MEYDRKECLLYLKNGIADDIYYDSNLPSYLQVKNLYKNGSNLKKVFRKLLIKWKIPLYKLILGDWYNEKYYDVIVIEALNGKREVIPILKKKYPDARIILWHWNSMFENSIKPDDPICDGCELWSFDPKDCKKYGMKFNSQWYNYNLTSMCRYEVEDSIDVFFIGANKNRGQTINGVKKILDKMGIKSKFHVVDSRNKITIEGIEYKPVIPYVEVLQNIKNTKVILDLVIDDQQGLSLRPLEALFHSKKLITNNKNIENYKFYNKNNIFIFGKDDIDNLHNFIKIPYVHIDDQLIQFFNVDNWLKRFLIGKEAFESFIL